ncbi:acyl-CoA thioesterase [uncultured Ruminococcus sp.]|uniref:acyl-CoA thioesterase n=1 Tax=uncultured Ruminococcus sp. TaxID=165186 RepID=UPI0025D098CB|nr:acyl-CoA thioesterase [uncultured Ruminococcus sp.]
MNKIRPYERKVFYYETDKMGIVHHSNYIRIFEEARVHYLGEAGMPFPEIEALGIVMPVLSVEAVYKRPLRFDEPFAVYLKIDNFNGASLHVSYRIISRETGLVCTEGSSSHCFTDNDLKVIRTKNKYPEVYDVFAKYSGLDFEEIFEG